MEEELETKKWWDKKIKGVRRIIAGTDKDIRREHTPFFCPTIFLSHRIFSLRIRTKDRHLISRSTIKTTGSVPIRFCARLTSRGP